MTLSRPRGPLTTSVFLLLNIYLVGPTSWFCVLFYIARSGLLHKAIAVLPYVKGLSERPRRCLQQQGVRAVFKSETTLRSKLARPKDAVDPANQDSVVYRIPCECDKVYIGDWKTYDRSVNKC